MEYKAQNPFDDEKRKSIDPSLASRAEQLRRKEEDLNRREQNLDQRSQILIIERNKSMQTILEEIIGLYVVHFFFTIS